MKSDFFFQGFGESNDASELDVSSFIQHITHTPSRRLAHEPLVTDTRSNLVRKSRLLHHREFPPQKVQQIGRCFLGQLKKQRLEDFMIHDHTDLLYLSGRLNLKVKQ